MTEQIEEALSQIPYDKLELTEEVQEQVFFSSVDFHRMVKQNSLF